MVERGMTERGHTVSTWVARPFLCKLAVGPRSRKWLGYFDQYVIFAVILLIKSFLQPRSTLFVFSDQALGMLVPLICRCPHVVHVHDLMALRSARGEYPENPTRLTGRIYQELIRVGFNKARCFVSVSESTRRDLTRFLGRPPEVSTVVYNGLNYPFSRMNAVDARGLLSTFIKADLSQGFVLHVGGNQWYKNRVGVLAAYEKFVRASENPLPLLMIGAPPTSQMEEYARRLPSDLVFFVSGLSDEQVNAAYSAATLLFFPSLAEGFGWPIAEAMAAGCIVLTTGEPPMTEVGGAAAMYVRRRGGEGLDAWSTEAARKISECVHLSIEAVELKRKAGYVQVRAFDVNESMASYERVYLNALLGGSKNPNVEGV